MTTHLAPSADGVDGVDVDAAGSPGSRRRARGSWRHRANVHGSPYAFIAPFFILFAIFGAFPIAFTFYVSMFRWNLRSGERTFIGLENYTTLLGDPAFWNATTNTLGLFVVATVPQLAAALAIANLLNRPVRGRTFFRLGILMPNVTSMVAVGIVFGFIFAERYGLATYLLGSVGLDGISWRDSRLTSWLAIASMVDWRWTGYNALIYLAAMQAIPRELYEAAAVDGAGPWRRFWTVTVPMIRPTILFTVIVSTIGGLQLFTEPLLFAYGRIQGGVDSIFQTLAMYIYQTTFVTRFDLGYGAAISWALFMMIIAIALTNFLLVRRSVRGVDG